MTRSEKPNGAGAAALLAAGLGVFTIGLMTFLAENLPVWGNALNWWNPVGPPSGKTSIGIIVWLVAWAILHTRYKDADVNLGRATGWTWVLIVLGWLGTFPPMFDLFSR